MVKSMADRCVNCGAELFTGQQFCRACGKPTRNFSGEEVPTQILPPEQAAGAPPDAYTSPLHSGRDTDPAFRQHYTAYQSPLAATQAAPPVAPPRPRRRSRARYWIAALLLLVFFATGASLLVGYFIREGARRTVRRVVVKPPSVSLPPPAVPVPEIPPIPDMAIAGETALDETGAEVGGDETVITKTFKLADGATFSIQNLNGPVTIEGWDSDKAEVKITKHGGSEKERRGAPVMHTYNEKELSFRTPPQSYAGLEEVEYEVKLPRRMGPVQINTIRSNVELSNLNAPVTVSVQQGNIEFNNVRGAANTQTTQGNIEVSLESLASGAAQTFNVINGNITLQFSPQVSADLQAETINGDIEIDDDFGLKVEKRMVGQHTAGPIGKGGPRLVAKAISGDIKIEQ